MILRRLLICVFSFTLTVVIGCASTGIQADPVYFPRPPASPHVVHLKSFNGLHELVLARPGLLEALRGGVLSPHVGTPGGVAYRDGHLYICDTDASVVHDWDLATGKAISLGRDGELILSKPVAVAVDDAGTVYVADTGRGEVVAFHTADSSPTEQLRPSGRERYAPVSLAVAGAELYVADIASHGIDIFSTDDTSRVESFGGVGSKPGRFYFPMGVSVSAAGHIFVSDMMNARVQVLDDGHEPMLSMGGAGNRYGDMGKPRHLAVGSDGVIFVADVEFGHVHLFNAQGQLLMLLGGPEDQPGGTPMPVGVAIAPTLPDALAALVPDDFRAAYYLFVTNSIGTKRVSLFAVGSAW